MLDAQKYSIEWPAFVHFENDPELLYFNDQSEWEKYQDKDNSDNEHFESEDRFIDSNGKSYSLTINDSPNQLSLDQILGLVKAHLSDQGSCCVAKIYASTIKETILLIKP